MERAFTGTRKLRKRKKSRRRGTGPGVRHRDGTGAAGCFKTKIFSPGGQPRKTVKGGKKKRKLGQGWGNSFRTKEKLGCLKKKNKGENTWGGEKNLRKAWRGGSEEGRGLEGGKNEGGKGSVQIKRGFCCLSGKSRSRGSKWKNKRLLRDEGEGKPKFKNFSESNKLGATCRTTSGEKGPPSCG